MRKGAGAGVETGYNAWRGGVGVVMGCGGFWELCRVMMSVESGGLNG